MRWREWLGVGERRWKKAPDEEVQPAKTLWDWLQLLIVPAILIGVTFVWSATQTRNDNRREDRRLAADRAAAKEERQDATLQTFLDQMSGLMLREKLLASKESDPVRAVARTVTLTTLRRVNESRKGEVVRFLHEARLIERGTAVESRSLVDLAGADLAGANLADADLAGADLDRANLDDADLTGAILTDAILTDAYLAGANLDDADLTGANFEGAYLADANLTDTDLTDANLRRANLEGVDLRFAFLTDADLTEANLTRADLTNAHLTGATLANAILTGAKGLPKGRP